MKAIYHFDLSHQVKKPFYLIFSAFLLSPAMLVATSNASFVRTGGVNLRELYGGNLSFRARRL